MRNLMLALGLSALSLIGAGFRTNQLLGEAHAVDEMIALIPLITGRMEQVQMWLEVEDASPDLSGAALVPLAERAAVAAQELEALHERSVHLTWKTGRGGDVSATAAENADMPVHRIDVMVRSFLRGVARTAEAGGPRRAAARRDMRRLAQNGLAVAFAENLQRLEGERAALHGALTLTVTLGGLGATLGLLLAAVFHIRGPRRVNAELEARIDEARTRVEEVEVYLRGAERDRARMMDLSAAGLKLPAERMRAAAGLLARTPLTETQGRVLHGLRQALEEIAGRIEGLRVLASQGDGRLRLTLRGLKPGAVYAEWLHLAQARAQAEGKHIVAEADLDRRVELRGDELMLRRALDRLLDDALRRSAKGGRVGIAAQLETTGRRGPELRVTVEHDGPAPGPSEIALIQAPFSSRPPSEATVYRTVDPFALAVVSAICMATGGGLDISQRLNGGARAVARLRLAPVSDFLDEQPEIVAFGSAMGVDADRALSPDMDDAAAHPEGRAGDALDLGVDAVPDGHAPEGSTRVDDGRDRRRSRREVPAPDPDSG